MCIEAYTLRYLGIGLDQMQTPEELARRFAQAEWIAKTETQRLADLLTALLGVKKK